jgi:hypothetical protein
MSAEKFKTGDSKLIKIDPVTGKNPSESRLDKIDRISRLIKNQQYKISYAGIAACLIEEAVLK